MAQHSDDGLKAFLAYTHSHYSVNEKSFGGMGKGPNQVRANMGSMLSWNWQKQYVRGRGIESVYSTFGESIRLGRSIWLGEYFVERSIWLGQYLVGEVFGWGRIWLEEYLDGGEFGWGENLIDKEDKNTIVVSRRDFKIWCLIQNKSVFLLSYVSLKRHFIQGIGKRSLSGSWCMFQIPCECSQCLDLEHMTYWCPSSGLVQLRPIKVVWDFQWRCSEF